MAISIIRLLLIWRQHLTTASSMGIRFYCPNGHKLNVKSFQAGRRGICPHCDVRFRIPQESQIPANSPKLRTGVAVAHADDQLVESFEFADSVPASVSLADREGLPVAI